MCAKKSETATSEKKTVAQIVIENFLKDVDEKGSMPWQRPYRRHNAFNYFTKQEYRGINRLILDGGEYMTANQINEYNKRTGEDFRFQKGIRWLPVVFFKKEQRSCTWEEIEQTVSDPIANPKDGFVGHDGYWTYWKADSGAYFKKRNVLRYYMVAERQHFKNSKGEMLPSRIETGEVVITQSNPQKVFDDYISRSGVKLEYTYGTPCYMPQIDTVQLNRFTSSEEAWFSTAFHELAHSTGHPFRLNRKILKAFGTEDYAKEECVAEIAAFLTCVETGITVMETSLSKEYENNLAYVAGWKKRIKNWGKDFVYIVSQADKAYEYIMGENGKPENLMPAETMSEDEDEE